MKMKLLQCFFVGATVLCFVLGMIYLVTNFAIAKMIMAGVLLSFCFMIFSLLIGSALLDDSHDSHDDNEWCGT